jgi:hypothetical protein
VPSLPRAVQSCSIGERNPTPLMQLRALQRLALSKALSRLILLRETRGSRDSSSNSLLPNWSCKLRFCESFLCERAVGMRVTLTRVTFRSVITGRVGSWVAVKSNSCITLSAVC